MEQDLPIAWAFSGWEPRSYLLRSGGVRGIDGFWRGLDQWWSHIHSEGYCEILQSVGINLVTTHFYKGLGRPVEEREMDEASQFADLCGKYGIRVLAHIEAGTISRETFQAWRPDVDDWLQRDADGRIVAGHGKSFRSAVCPNCIEQRTLITEVITAALGRNFVGVWIDSATEYRCRCKRCQALFTEYLCTSPFISMVPEVARPHVGIPSFEDDRPQPTYYAWLEYRSQVVTEYVRALHDHSRSVAPTKLFCVNHVFARPTLSRDHQALRTLPLLQMSDLTFMGTHRNVRHQGSLITSIPEQVLGESSGRRIVAAGCITESGSDDMVKGREDVIALAMEPVIWGHHPSSSIWGCRPTAETSTRYDDPVLGQQLADCHAVIREHWSAFQSSCTAEVLVVRSDRSCLLDGASAPIWTASIEWALVALGIPFQTRFLETVIQSRDRLPPCIIIAGQSCLSDMELHFVNSLADDHKVLIFGDSGVRDECARLRDLDLPSSRRRAFPNIPADAIHTPVLALLHRQTEQGTAVYPALASPAFRRLTEVVSSLVPPCRLPVSLVIPPLPVNTYARLTAAEGRVLIHVLQLNCPAEPSIGLSLRTVWGAPQFRLLTKLPKESKVAVSMTPDNLRSGCHDMRLTGGVSYALIEIVEY